MQNFFWALSLAFMIVCYFLTHEIEQMEKVEPRLLRSVGLETSLPRQRGSVAKACIKRLFEEIFNVVALLFGR